MLYSLYTKRPAKAGLCVESLGQVNSSCGNEVTLTPEAQTAIPKALNLKP